MSASPRIHPRYIVDDKGKPRDVVLTIREYKRLLEMAEDAEDARELDEARKNPGKMHKLSDVIAEMKRDGLL